MVPNADSIYNSIAHALPQFQAGREVAFTIETDDLSAFTSEYEMGFYLRPTENNTLSLCSDYDRLEEVEYNAPTDQFSIDHAVASLLRAVAEHTADFDARYGEA